MHAGKLRLHTHTQNMWYVLPFHCNNGYANVPQYYAKRTLPVSCPYNPICAWNKHILGKPKRLPVAFCVHEKNKQYETKRLTSPLTVNRQLLLSKPWRHTGQTAVQLQSLISASGEFHTPAVPPPIKNPGTQTRAWVDHEACPDRYTGGGGNLALAGVRTPDCPARSQVNIQTSPRFIPKPKGNETDS